MLFIANLSESHPSSNSYINKKKNIVKTIKQLTSFIKFTQALFHNWRHYTPPNTPFASPRRPPETSSENSSVHKFRIKPFLPWALSPHIPQSNPRAHFTRYTYHLAARKETDSMLYTCRRNKIPVHSPSSRQCIYVLSLFSPSSSGCIGELCG